MKSLYYKHIYFLTFAFYLIVTYASGIAAEFVYRPQFAMKGIVFSNSFWEFAIEPYLEKQLQEAEKIALVAGICWEPHPLIFLSPQLKYYARGTSPDENEFRPRMSIYLESAKQSIQFSIRNRFEIRVRENDENFWRYRLRLKVKYALFPDVILYAHEEIFYKFGNDNEIHDNRIGCGLCTDLNEDMKLIIEYRFDHERKRGHWRFDEAHLLTTFSYSFKSVKLNKWHFWDD